MKFFKNIETKILRNNLKLEIEFKFKNFELTEKSKVKPIAMIKHKKD